jgi:serine/threonine protein kinase
VPALHPNLRTTILQAFARTMVDESRGGSDAPGAVGEGTVSALPPSAVVLPGEGDLVGEHYQLVRLLGQGMFGKVYVAQRVDVPEHQVALKLLPRFLYASRNVERELVMLATVGHPHLVQLKDHGTTHDYVWLTMPVYQGETLAERLSRGPLGLREAHDIFLPIARGLEALHAAGLRHQDVKPENIYLAVFGGRVHPIILDLGVAAEKDATFVAGTALYAAPEQVAALTGTHPAAIALCEKMDTYGLAATLLMALVGPALFPGETATDREQLERAHTIRAHAPLHPDALPDLSGPPREQIVGEFTRWMALDQGVRPSMRELAEELSVLLEPEREEQRREEQRRSRQRAMLLRFKLMAGAMALIGVAAAAVVYNMREKFELVDKLAQAQAQAQREGKASFDKIETCNTAHQMTTRELTECQAIRDKDRALLKKSLDDVMKSGSTTQAEHARQTQAYEARIKACEDTATAAQQVCVAEATRRTDESAKQKAALEKERDDQRALVEAAKAHVAVLEKERDRFASERLACSEERDACQAAAKATSKPAPPGPASPGPASPGPAPALPPSPPTAPSGGVAPATTSGPTATPGPSAGPPPPPLPPPPLPSPPPAPAPAPKMTDPYAPSP